MSIRDWARRGAAATILSLVAFAATAADYPAPKRGTWVAKVVSIRPA